MKNFIRNTVIAGTIFTTLSSPILAQDIKPLIAPKEEVIPISYTYNHWSEPYIEQLKIKFNVDTVFNGKNLDSDITLDDFKNSINLTIDKGYTGEPESLSREAVVHELTKIWAGMTGKKLEEIVTIKMIVYADRDKIDGKYDHSLTVAFMYNIAKGKGNREFDPKDNVTYGELATLICNTLNAIEEELKPEIPSIVEGNLETRGNYTISDGKVTFDFELFSNYEKTKELSFSSGQQFQLTITDESGNEVYKYSDGKFYTEALILKNIGPGESIKWSDEWDMTNKEGIKLTSGNYKATIKILVIQGEEKSIEDSELTKIIEFSL
jgi:hypothetical protein